MSKIKYTVWERIGDGLRISRKAKKKILGVRISKNKLRLKIRQLKFDKDGEPNNDFCANCGCGISRQSEQMAQYPDCYIIWYCIRCGSQTGSMDNSRYVSELEKIEI